jgi:hypothetical protein
MPAGALEALRGHSASLLTLRSLVGGKLGISKQDTLVHSKEALWRLGQAIETEVDIVWKVLLEDEMLWRGVKGLTGHKATPSQLQQLYQTMKRQGFQRALDAPCYVPPPIADGSGEIPTTHSLQWSGCKDCCRPHTRCTVGGWLCLLLPQDMRAVQ